MMNYSATVEKLLGRKCSRVRLGFSGSVMGSVLPNFWCCLIFLFFFWPFKKSLESLEWSVLITCTWKKLYLYFIDTKQKVTVPSVWCIGCVPQEIHSYPLKKNNRNSYLMWKTETLSLELLFQNPGNVFL